MQGHVCSNMLLNLMMNFNLMKKITFLCFHVHNNSQINHFNSIFKSGKFWGVTHGDGVVGADGPGDLANGEREAVRRSHGAGDDDRLVFLGSSMHTPYLALHCRRNMVSSLPRGMPKIVDYRQTDAQATNKMVMQDRHKVLSRFGRRKGVIPMSCV